jgi:hypothetical protein
LYVGGMTEGVLQGSVNQGYRDAFFRKYDVSGNYLWTRQFGFAGHDEIRDIATDVLGNVYVAGSLNSYPAGPGLSDPDAFLSKYDSNGNLAWNRYLSTEDYEVIEGVAVDISGNVFVTGSIAAFRPGHSSALVDCFIAKYGPDGTQTWIRHFGSDESDISSNIATDQFGSVYISGRTDGLFGEALLGWNDAFVTKFDADGNRQWLKQFGSNRNDHSYGIAVDPAGYLLLVGGGEGAMSDSFQGKSDMFLSKLTLDGNFIWTRQLGTSDYDYAFDVDVDDSGSAFITGYTYGDLGSENQGGSDAVLAKYSGTGDHLWTLQFGSASVDEPYDVTIDAHNRILLSGTTGGGLNGPSTGSADGFLIMIVPEPSSFINVLTCAAFLTLFTICVRWRSSPSNC